MHLRVEDVPEYAYVPDDALRAALLERAGRLREAVLGKGELIDRDAVCTTRRALRNAEVRHRGARANSLRIPDPAHDVRGLVGQSARDDGAFGKPCKRRTDSAPRAASIAIR